MKLVEPKFFSAFNKFFSYISIIGPIPMIQQCGTAIYDH